MEAVVLACYTAILALVIPFHEQWSDEAQAWLIARDNSFWDIYRRRLHYEGAPPGWHFLLRVYQMCGGSWHGVNWFSALFAVAGTYLLLRWSPFPAVVRYLLPFTFFLQYQYAVIARSYVLFPLLVWLCCLCFTLRPRRPLPFVFVCALLGTISVQGLVFSGCLALLYFWQGVRRKEVSPRGLLPALALLLVAWTFSAYAAIPAPDIDFAVRDSVAEGPVHRALVRILGETPSVPYLFAPTPPILADDGTEIAPIFTRPPPPPPAPPSWLHDTGNRLVWESNIRPPGPWLYLHLALASTFDLLSEITWPISNSNLLACLFLVSCVLWTISRRSLWTLLPYLALLLMGTVLWVADHHTGLALVALFGGLWITAQQAPARPNRPWLEQGFVGLLTLVLLQQAAWTAVTCWQELYHPYDGGEQTAKYLKTFTSGTTMVGFGFWSTSLQPRFARNPFRNEVSSYFTWSTHVHSTADDLYTVSQHPDVVVYSWERRGSSPMRNQWVPFTPLDARPYDPVYDRLFQEGYHISREFCGERFARLGSSFVDCDEVFVRTP